MLFNNILITLSKVQNPILPHLHMNRVDESDLTTQEHHRDYGVTDVRRLIISPFHSSCDVNRAAEDDSRSIQRQVKFIVHAEGDKTFPQVVDADATLGDIGHVKPEAGAALASILHNRTNLFIRLKTLSPIDHQFVFKFHDLIPDKDPSQSTWTTHRK